MKYISIVRTEIAKTNCLKFYKGLCTNKPLRQAREGGRGLLKCPIYLIRAK